MTDKTPKPLIVCLAVYFFVLFLIVFHLLFYTDVPEFMSADDSAVIRDYMDGWELTRPTTCASSSRPRVPHGWPT